MKLYPRTCGGDPMTVANMEDYSGVSPHMRG